MCLLLLDLLHDHVVPLRLGERRLRLQLRPSLCRLLDFQCSSCSGPGFPVCLHVRVCVRVRLHICLCLRRLHWREACVQLRHLCICRGRTSLLRGHRRSWRQKGMYLSPEGRAPHRRPHGSRLLLLRLCC